MKKQLDQFQWDKMTDFIFELSNDVGKRLAEICLDDKTGRWKWVVLVDPDWQIDETMPSGLANSSTSAKAICEEILHGTYGDVNSIQ